MNKLAYIVGLFGLVELVLIWSLYLRAHSNYKISSLKLDEATRSMWRVSLIRTVAIGSIVGGIAIGVAFILYFVAPDDRYLDMSFRLTTSVLMLAVTSIVLVGSFVFMSYKIRQHQIVGNQELAQTAIQDRRKVIGLLVIFVLIEVASVILAIVRSHISGP